MTTPGRISDPTGPNEDRSRRRILYVEDDADIWQITKHKLRAKYDLVHAATDQEACRLLSDPNEVFQAVLMDIELKGSLLNGLQLVKLLRGNLPLEGLPEYARGVSASQVPVIVLSAYVGAYKQEDLIALGANRALAKPVDFVDLTMTLTEVNLRQARSSMRPPAD
jgi:CheY-like chemotaxis protein